MDKCIRVKDKPSPLCLYPVSGCFLNDFIRFGVWMPRVFDLVNGCVKAVLVAVTKNVITLNRGILRGFVFIVHG